MLRAEAVRVYLEQKKERAAADERGTVPWFGRGRRVSNQLFVLS